MRSTSTCPSVNIYALISSCWKQNTNNHIPWEPQRSIGAKKSHPWDLLLGLLERRPQNWTPEKSELWSVNPWGRKQESCNFYNQRYTLYTGKSYFHCSLTDLCNFSEIFNVMLLSNCIKLFKFIHKLHTKICSSYSLTSSMQQLYIRNGPTDHWKRPK